MNEEKYRNTAGMVLNEIDRRLRKVSMPIPESASDFVFQMNRISHICKQMALAIVEDSVGNPGVYGDVEELIRDLKEKDRYQTF